MSLTEAVKVIRMRESRAKEMAKNEAKNEKNKLRKLRVKAAKDLAKTNAAENTADLTVIGPKFVVGSHVKTIVNTLPGTDSKEPVLVEGNIIYK